MLPEAPSYDMPVSPPCDVLGAVPVVAPDAVGHVGCLVRGPRLDVDAPPHGGAELRSGRRVGVVVVTEIPCRRVSEGDVGAVRRVEVAALCRGGGRGGEGSTRRGCAMTLVYVRKREICGCQRETNDIKKWGWRERWTRQDRSIDLSIDRSVGRSVGRRAISRPLLTWFAAVRSANVPPYKSSIEDILWCARRTRGNKLRADRDPLLLSGPPLRTQRSFRWVGTEPIYFILSARSLSHFSLCCAVVEVLPGRWCYFI